MKNKKLFILFLVTAIPLWGCGTPNNSSNNSSNSPLTISDLKDVMSFIGNSSSYTVSVNKTVGVQNPTSFAIYLTEQFFVTENPNNSYGYMLSDEGVFQVNKYNNNLISSELLLDANGNIINSLKNIVPDVSDFSIEGLEGLTEAKITSRVEAFKYFDFVGIDRLDYTTFKDIIISFNNDVFSFAINFETMNYTGSVSNINTTTNDTYSTYLTEVGYFVPTPELNTVREAFKLDNFTQLSYDDNQALIGYQKFTENYSILDYIQESISTMDTGYFLAKNKYNPVTAETFDGLYMYYRYGESSSFIEYPAGAYDPNKSFVELNVYPKYMNLWSQLQYFTASTRYTNAIETTKYDLIEDFLKNFQITSLLENYTMTSLEIVLDDVIIDNYAQTAVTFNLYVSPINNPSQVYYQNFDFVDFGVTSDLKLESFLSSLIDVA